MNVIIHCGLPKTGSTSIQKMLFENSAALLAKRIVVPVFGPNYPAHHKLAASKFAAQRLTQEAFQSKTQMLDASRSALVGVLEGEHEPNASVILSSESFADRGSFDSVAALTKLIAEKGGRIQAVAYIRPPAQHVPSAVQQDAKHYIVDETIKIKAFAHIARAARVQQLFGRENVEFRIFDRSTLVDSDVVSDFLEWMKQKSLDVPAVESVVQDNESIGAPACALLWKLKKRSGTTSLESQPHFNAARRLVIGYEAKHPSGKLSIPGEWKAAIDQLVRSEWNELVARSSNSDADKNRFFIDEAQQDYGLDQARKYAWILSYFDPAYVSSVVAFGLESEDEAIRKAAKRISEKLT